MEKTLHIPVAEIMTRDLLIVRPQDNLEKVNDIFRSNTLHHIPVVDADGALKGIISKMDFNRVNHLLVLFNEEKYGDYNYRLYKCMRAEEIMTKNLATLAPDDPMTVAVDIFKENLFHALPVVENGLLVGLVTTHDVISYCCDELMLLQ